ncbi:hypothetical protein [Desulfolutivibrio sulfoxidireducens]|uniref:hypothetical protein n=1 Tax=Desulfolutivibrio sulfoxidireducens TaxID=2773299 RepID=UPI00159DB5E5|nr:hypothetical protein [Desulfolutivibrio sulfoxidireducens]QLA17701.1 hypothetical protein GD605_17260 [Desulfolutivibrio sulfoxidireducens]QLA21277.1 hypothetical protein GD604_16875 [Desulfolutivibrio sulfoxidireducens]
MALRLSTGLRDKLLGEGSFKEIMADGVVRIFPGTQPTSADDAEGATQLVQITLASGTFTAGAADNGLEFGTASGGILAKSSGEVWSGVASVTGTAGWFRFYANDLTTGASTTQARFDGSISTSGAQLNMSSTAITAGATTTIDSFTITFPAS